MIEIKGLYNTAKIFTDEVEPSALAQIKELCDQKFCKNSKIRIMPDVHAGAGCTIGTTMTIKNTVVPNLVGVDIGCGMETIKTNLKQLNVEKLDEIIYKNIPSGFDIRSKPHQYASNIDLEKLKCKKHVDIKRAILSIGTLGGGNHFIEAAYDEEGYIYIVVHSGSRHLGKETAEYYQNKAYEELLELSKNRAKKIEKKHKKHKKNNFEELDIDTEDDNDIIPTKINKALAYLVGKSFNDYIHDMKIIQEYAKLNRKAMMDIIIEKLNLEVIDRFTTIHNYIDIDEMILRKGAISAKFGEKVLIPMNMRDGSLICIGKGNPDWNYSAPHGAGRIMSRNAAKHNISILEFKKAMEGIYTTTANLNTIDEAPMAYKPMEEIIKHIKDTVEIKSIIKPIYNFKACE